MLTQAEKKWHVESHWSSGCHRLPMRTWAASESRTSVQYGRSACQDLFSSCIVCSETRPVTWKHLLEVNLSKHIIKIHPAFYWIMISPCFSPEYSCRHLQSDSKNVRNWRGKTLTHTQIVCALSEVVEQNIVDTGSDIKIRQLILALSLPELSHLSRYLFSIRKYPYPGLPIRRKIVLNNEYLSIRLDSCMASAVVTSVMWHRHSASPQQRLYWICSLLWRCHSTLEAFRTVPARGLLLRITGIFGLFLSHSQIGANFCLSSCW